MILVIGVNVHVVKHFRVIGARKATFKARSTAKSANEARKKKKEERVPSVGSDQVVRRNGGDGAHQEGGGSWLRVRKERTDALTREQTFGDGSDLEDNGGSVEIRHLNVENNVTDRRIAGK